jgi:hypothetical protein
MNKELIASSRREIEGLGYYIPKGENGDEIVSRLLGDIHSKFSQHVINKGE